MIEKMIALNVLNAKTNQIEPIRIFQKLPSLVSVSVLCLAS